MEDDYSITISGEDAIVTIGEGKVGCVGKFNRRLRLSVSMTFIF